ncbi:MAG: ribosome biogenesis GTPase YlqF [Erysipelotrichaceae bacterium]|nr:ribosome biogenesis GTPase YlqF [Erysipelotrichaceae bacterium]
MAEEKNINRTTINWFPGHMAKAKREMQENIRSVDMVIELRDARIPLSSQNPLLAEVIGSKPRCIVLAKKDQADDRVTESWISWLAGQGIYAIAMNLLKDSIAKTISTACQKIMADKIAKQKARGMRHVEIKAMVVGIPNVGKSTLINSVTGKKAAKTANHPGVTRNLQWIKVSPDVALLDTPGVLWPKFEDMEIGYKLALCGSVSENVVPVEELCNYGLDYLKVHYPEILKQRYGVDSDQDNEKIVADIARNRSIVTGDEGMDVRKAYLLLYKDFRDGTIGKVSWESPDEDAQ